MALKGAQWFLKEVDGMLQNWPKWVYILNSYRVQYLESLMHEPINPTENMGILSLALFGVYPFALCL
jgi:hypothetical protein